MKLSSHKLMAVTLNVLIFILAIAPSLRSLELLLFPPHTGVSMFNGESFEVVMNEPVSYVCFFFEAVDVIVSERAWLHFWRLCAITVV